MSQKPLLQNEMFDVYEIKHTSERQGHRVLHFCIKEIKVATQHHIQLLTGCMQRATTAEQFKCSIILDTHSVKAISALKSLMNLDIQKLRRMEKNNLMHFVMVTSSATIRNLSNAAIRLRGASSYARVVSTLPEALAFISQ